MVGFRWQARPLMPAFPPLQLLSAPRGEFSILARLIGLLPCTLCLSKYLPLFKAQINLLYEGSLA